MTVPKYLRDVAHLEQRRAVAVVRRSRSSPCPLRALADVVVDEHGDQQDHAEEEVEPVGVPAGERCPMDAMPKISAPSAAPIAEP